MFIVFQPPRFVDEPNNSRLWSWRPSVQQPNFPLLGMTINNQTLISVVITLCHLFLESEVVELEAKCSTTQLSSDCKYTLPLVYRKGGCGAGGQLSSDCDDTQEPNFHLIVMTLCHLFLELEVVELEASLQQPTFPLSVMTLCNKWRLWSWRPSVQKPTFL